MDNHQPSDTTATENGSALSSQSSWSEMANNRQDTVTFQEKLYVICWVTLMSYIYWALTLPFYLGIALVRLVCARVTISDFDQRYVVITGCDSGFGKMLATRLAKKGLNIFAGCLTDDGVQRLKDLRKNNALVLKGKLLPLKLDVCSDESVAQFAQHVRENLPSDTGLWALVNNAGIAGDNMPDDWLQMDTFHNTMDVNFYGCVRMVHALQELLKPERGRIVFLSSILGHSAHSNSAPYNASKFAVTGYAETIRHELYHFGVSVSVIAPGFHRTAITDMDVLCDKLTKRWEILPPSLKAQYPKDGYLEPRKACTKEFLKRVTTCNDVQEVVDAMAHAVVSRFPHTKYWVGLDSRWNIALQRFLPADMCVWMARQVEKELKDGNVQPPENLAKLRQQKPKEKNS